MLVNGYAVARLDDCVPPHQINGYVRKFMHASQGRMWWAVDWEDGSSSVMAEHDLINVTSVEWDEACSGAIPECERCDSYYYRQCAMRRGHKTRFHRCMEINWTDALAAEYGRTRT